MTPILSPLSESERFDWLRLCRSDGIGPRTFAGLLQRFGTAAAALDALPVLAKRRTGVSIASRDSVAKELSAGAKRGLRFVGLQEPEYPPALRAIESAPPIITVRGDPGALQRPMVAIVGSRNASGAGLIFTERLAAGIGGAGIVVVSGLARGIDVRAHRAALATGTVAVLAGGHDKIYPVQHAALAAEIADGGAVVSEMALGWEPRGRDFPRRNRIVSGLALATVVVEAALRSGSLITARFANEQGREVFAVPGSPLDPRAEGTNGLLRQGASLCTRSDDVIDAVVAMTRQDGPSEPRRRMLWHDLPDLDDLSTEEATVEANAPGGREQGSGGLAHLLGPSPISIDDLVRLSGQSAAQVRAALLDLELDGLASLEGGLVRSAGSAVS